MFEGMGGKVKRRFGTIVFIVVYTIVWPLYSVGDTTMTHIDSILTLTEGGEAAFLSDTLFSEEEKYIMADRLSQSYSHSAADKSLVYDQFLIQRALKKGDSIALSKFLLRYYRHLNRSCAFDKADSVLKILKPFYYRKGDERKSADYFMMLANNYYDWSKYEQSVQMYEKAKKIYEKLRIKPKIADCLKAEGAIWAGYGDYERAIGLLQRSQDIYSAIGDEAGLAALHNTMGVVMQNWGKLERALDYYHLALDYYKKKNDLTHQLNMYLHIVDIYRLKKEYVKALNLLRYLKKLSRKVNHKKLNTIVYSNLGELFYDMAMYDSALYYQNLVLPLKYKLGDRRRIVISLNDLMKIYIKLKRYDEAIQLAPKVLHYASLINANTVKMDVYMALSKMYEERENYRKAYDYLKKYHQIEKVVFNEQSRKMVNELEVKYKAARKERENAVLKKENSLKAIELKREEYRRNYLIIFLFFFFILSGIVFYFFMYRARMNRVHIAILEKKNKEILEASSKLKETYDKLIVSRERYKSIVENATIGMYRTTKDGKILFANNTLLNMLGYKENDLKKINLNVEKQNRQEFIHLLESQEIITGREDYWKRADGSFMWVNESAWIIRDVRGEIMYYEGIVEDITLRKKAEEEAKNYRVTLEKTNKQLREINREMEWARKEAEEANKAKSEFLANISHEIRTPLNSIVGFIDLLEKKTTDSAGLNYIRSIRMSSNSLLRLINDILDLSKIQAGKIELVLEPVYVRNLLEELRFIFYPQVEEKGIDFRINTEIDRDLSLFLDVTRIRQVLFNIIGNAIKFTDKGYVELNAVTKPCVDEKNKLSLFVTVKDTGIGIDRDELNRVFDAFVQSKENRNKNLLGTGLGLSISKKLVELMGGSISVTSTKGSGSQFHIVIPCIETSTSLAELKTVLSEKNLQMRSEKMDVEEPKKEDMDPTVLALFKKEFSGLVLTLQNSHLMSDVKSTAEQMVRFAKVHELKALHVHAALLLETINQFDVERMEYYLSKMINFYNFETN